MPVLSGYIQSMAISRSQYLQKWEERKNTIHEHIIKALLIIDDCDWLDEVDVRVLELSRFETKGRLSQDTFTEINEDYAFESQHGIYGAISHAIRVYCLDSSNKTNTAYVRDYETQIKDIETWVNSIFSKVVEYVYQAHELDKGNYVRGSFKQDSVVKTVIKKAHAIKSYNVWKCNANSPKKELTIVRSITANSNSEESRCRHPNKRV